MINTEDEKIKELPKKIIDISPGHKSNLKILKSILSIRPIISSPSIYIFNLVSNTEKTFGSLKEEFDMNSAIYEKIEVENAEYNKDKKLFNKRLRNLPKKHNNKINKEDINLITLTHESLNKITLIQSNQADISHINIISDIKITTNDEGNMQINNYLILEILGKGSFGTVNLCYNLLDEKYYVKKN